MESKALAELLGDCSAESLDADVWKQATTDSDDLLRRLCLACEHGSAAVVRLLLEARASPNQLNPRGVTPLVVAADKGNAEIVRLLLESGARADLATTDGSGRTPLHASARRGDTESARLLLGASADASARARVRKPVQLQGATASMLTPLHLACLHGSEGVADLDR